MGFNLENYEPVEERIDRFYGDHPNGRIVTEIEAERDDFKFVVFKASVFRSPEESDPAATGFAYEVKDAGNVNRTSHIENCETSAIGRALANLNYAAKGKRASREEMTKASAEARPAQTSNLQTRREVSAESVGESVQTEPKPEPPSAAGSPLRSGEGVADSPPKRQDSTPASPATPSPVESGGGVLGGEVRGIPAATDLVEAYGKSKVLVTARNIAKANGATVPTSTDEIDEDLAKLVGKHFERVGA